MNFGFFDEEFVVLLVYCIGNVKYFNFQLESETENGYPINYLQAEKYPHFF